VATSTFKGRTTAGSGSPEDLTGTQATALLDTFTSTLKGLAPSSGGGTTNFLRADGTWATPPGGGGTVTSVSVVTANGVSGSVANATTTPAITLTLGAITPSSVAATGTVTGSNLSGTNTGDQTITLTGNVTGSGTGSFATTIAAGVVTNSMLANVSTATFKGRTTAGSGSPEDLTGTQATALLDTFTSSLKGLAPASGGGTTNFLRADGTWAAPGGGGGSGTVTDVSVVTANGVSGTVANSTTTPAITLTLGAITPSSVSASGAISDVAGNVRSLPQNSQTSAYSLQASDNGKYINITTGGITVPASVFTAGQAVVIYNASASNQTITQGASVTMYLASTTQTGNRTLASYGVATVLCVGSNTFVITGSGLS
jgi:hypothetical protein